VAARRETWFEAQPDLDPERLVFIDETSASTKMARFYGRSKRGTRCRAPVPHGHWKTTTFTGALRLSGLCRTDGAGQRDDKRMVYRLCPADPGTHPAPR
jgi:hypothetical protein